MAIAELIMPKMGESIMEATILRWHKQVGDFVKMDETVLDIATDKVDSEVPSTTQGIIKELLYNVNDVVPVGSVLARIETEVFSEATVPEYTAPTEQIYSAPVSEPVYYQPQPEFVTPTPAQEFIPFVPQTVQPIGVPSNNRFFSPLVLNIANSEGLSLSELERITGTGADGRVSKKDVLQYIADKRAGRVSNFLPQSSFHQSSYTPTPPTESFVAVPSVVENIQEVVAPVTQQVASAIENEVVFQKQEVDNYPINETKVENVVQEMQDSSFAASETSQDLHIETPEEETTVSEVAAEETLSKEITAPPVESIKASTPAPEFNPAMYKNAEIVEMDRMRKLIAKHMVNSKQTSPHVTSFTEADVTNMVTWRNKTKEEFEKREGMKITFTPMFIECVLKVMKRYPIINSSVVGDRIIIKKDFNIGMATALPNGNLIVPVIKNASELSFIDLTRSVNTLADNARNGRLSPDDVTEGTFTFTNVGTFGSLMGTPIINQPQVAILAVGEIKKRPVVIETDKGDFIGIRHMMYLSLSYDHRIIDGSVGASFLSDIAKELEAWDLERQLKYVVKEWYVE